MKSLDFGRYALTSCVAAAMLAACGGSQPPIGAPGAMPQTLAIATHAGHGKSWMQERPALPIASNAASASKSKGYKATPPLLYVANSTPTDNDLRIYHLGAKDPAPLATITDGIEGPNGDCIDGAGTLYVTNDPASGPGWVSEYPLGETVLSKIIKDGINTPAYCAVDAKGSLWVTNAGLNDAVEYLRGSTKPHLKITSGLHYPLGVAIDQSGILYVANGEPGGQQSIEVYSPGGTSPSRTITNGITFPGGIAVDSSGTLYVTNISQNNVVEYRSGEDSPFQMITESMHNPEGVIVNKKGVLYVANSQSENSSVAEFRLGSLQPMKRQITNGLFNPVGVAYYPPLLP
ncbi:MAG: hypothetical protein WBX26_07160 [Candidatus Cybelea sp.]